jgi:hypothetical protein
VYFCAVLELIEKARSTTKDTKNTKEEHQEVRKVFFGSVSAFAFLPLGALSWCSWCPWWLIFFVRDARWVFGLLGGAGRLAMTLGGGVAGSWGGLLWWAKAHPTKLKYEARQ